MKYSKVQYDLWRVKDRLSRKLSMMTSEEIEQYFANTPKRVEAKLGRPLRLRKDTGTMLRERRAMRELHLYIETSVWSNWLADDAPEQRDQTQEFLRKCRRAAGAAVLYVSEIVMDELQAASPRLAQELVRLVREHGAVMLRPDSAALELAEAYATHGAIPSSQRADRLHAAIATVAELDILVSWNYRHLVNISRRRKVNSVNGLLGYPKGIEIVSPPEVFEDEV